MLANIFILIPSRNRAQLLKKCLACIAAQTYPHHFTYVINDGSSDNTSAIINHFSKTQEIKGNGQLWWTGAMRLGISQVLPQVGDNDFILLMNDDTIFEPDYFQNILSTSQSNHRAIITSVCLDEQTKSIVLEAGVLIDWSKSSVDIPLKPPKDLISAPLTPVDTACGRGTLIPFEVFKKIGNFSRFLPHYKADYEFICRAKNAGFPVYISYLARVYATDKAGGIKFIPGKKVTFKEFWQQAFSRRSKSNLIDELMFLFFCSSVPTQTFISCNVDKKYFF